MGFGLHAGWAIEGAVGKRETKRGRMCVFVFVCVGDRVCMCASVWMWMWMWVCVRD